VLCYLMNKLCDNYAIRQRRYKHTEPNYIKTTSFEANTNTLGTPTPHSQQHCTQHCLLWLTCTKLSLDGKNQCQMPNNMKHTAN